MPQRKQNATYYARKELLFLESLLICELSDLIDVLSLLHMLELPILSTTISMLYSCLDIYVTTHSNGAFIVRIDLQYLQ